MKIIGHRGCRGVMPENTFAAFDHALRLGVTAIELDVVVTGEGRLLVSHDPYMHHEICTHPAGISITAANEKSFNIFEMDEALIASFDCGMKSHPRFPDQANLAVKKPYLTDVLDRYLPGNIHFFIELKSDPDWYGTFQPFPLKYAELIVRELRPYAGYDTLVLMSFDAALLNELAAISSDYHLGLVTESERLLEEQLADLHFKPVAVCPRFDLLNTMITGRTCDFPFNVFPWTVNTEADRAKLSHLDIQGIITDYPGRFMRFLNR